MHGVSLLNNGMIMPNIFLFTAEYHPIANEAGGAVRYKFAFQWCESQGDPWWMTSSNGDCDSRASASPAALLITNPENEIKAEACQQPNLAGSVEQATTPLTRTIPSTSHSSMI